MYIIGKILSKITRDTMTISCIVNPHFGCFHNLTIKRSLCRPYQSLCPPVTYYQQLNILWIFMKFRVLVIYKQLSSKRSSREKPAQ